MKIRKQKLGTTIDRHQHPDTSVQLRSPLPLPPHLARSDPSQPPSLIWKEAEGTRPKSQGNPNSYGSTEISSHHRANLIGVLHHHTQAKRCDPDILERTGHSPGWMDRQIPLLSKFRGDSCLCHPPAPSDILQHISLPPP